MLHDWLGVEALCQRKRHADHSRATFDAVLDTCERIARDKFAPFNRLVDTEEPRAVLGEDGGREQGEPGSQGCKRTRTEQRTLGHAALHQSRRNGAATMRRV